MVDGMSYLEVTLEGKIQVQQMLPLLEDPVEVPPGRAEALGHGAVDLGPGLLGEDHLIRLPQQLLHRALLAVQRRDHINLGTCLGMICDKCCVVLHRFHNRLYNHGEGPY